MRIEHDIDGRACRPLDPRRPPRALVWMNERYLHETLGPPPQTPVATVVDTLWTIWVRTLYPPRRSPHT